MPLCFGASVSVRASSIMRSARCAPDVQIFWPLMMKSSPSRTARVCSDARSEPAPGSLKPWHQNVSPERMPERCSRFCSSVPWTMIVGPARPIARKLRTRRACARHLLVEDELLHDAEARAAVLLRPRRRDPAALRERAQPVAFALILADADAEHRVVRAAEVVRQLVREKSRTSARNAASSVSL